MKTPIKDFYGRIIGWVEDEPNGNKILRDFYGRVLGKYDARSDVTRDFYGRIITRGDNLSMLLNQKIR